MSTLHYDPEGVTSLQVTQAENWHNIPNGGTPNIYKINIYFFFNEFKKLMLYFLLVLQVPEKNCI